MELTSQYASKNASGFNASGFCATYALQLEACAAHGDEPHTAPAQAPQKVVSKTCATVSIAHHKHSAHTTLVVWNAY